MQVYRDETGRLILDGEHMLVLNFDPSGATICDYLNEPRTYTNFVVYGIWWRASYRAVLATLLIKAALWICR